MNEELLPTFIIAGAGKSGTTLLDRILRQNPEIGMSRVKEPCYFCWQDLPADRNQFAIKSLEKYRALFTGTEGKRAIGEISPHYLARPLVPARIKQLLPHCKLVFIFRNPVERAYSLYMHFRRDGIENNPDFLDALENSRFAWNYREEGLYAAALSGYLEQFPESQIKLFFFEDLVQDPATLVAELYDFIGVSADVAATYLSERVNASGVPRSAVLRKLLYIAGRPWVRGLSRNFCPSKVRERGLGILHRWIAGDVEKLPFPQAAKESLISYYRSDVRALSELTGRDLDHWLTVE